MWRIKCDKLRGRFVEYDTVMRSHRHFSREPVFSDTLDMFLLQGSREHFRLGLTEEVVRAQVKPGGCTGERALHCRARTLSRSFRCIRARTVSESLLHTWKRDKRDVLVIFGVSTTGVREVHKSFLEYRNVNALNSPVVVYIRFYVKILSLKKEKLGQFCVQIILSR
ncbi:hypothetical protein ALC57_05449 [Trachymyrmex cornetzi]|uniref:Uncharacterized protein n=1 Tax=Trachymyrmex cornetzi TaxID=471704 RepID=A0A195EBK8_9HYME|nr:hypothetical protein ALC57_05449 [Trachymyrmex cornetzi]